jgi:hypothetical protein
MIASLPQKKSMVVAPRTPEGEGNQRRLAASASLVYDQNETSDRRAVLNGALLPY